MQELIVEIPERSYPIIVVDGLLANAQALRARLRACIQGSKITHSLLFKGPNAACEGLVKVLSTR